MSNIDLARELYASFARGDLDAVRAGMTDDIAWIEPPSLPYGSQIGFDAVLQKRHRRGTRALQRPQCGDRT
jgi:ketosteroid isomerase-like protein